MFTKADKKAIHTFCTKHNIQETAESVIKAIDTTKAISSNYKVYTLAGAYAAMFDKVKDELHNIDTWYLKLYTDESNHRYIQTLKSTPKGNKELLNMIEDLPIFVEDLEVYSGRESYLSTDKQELELKLGSDSLYFYKQ